MQSPLVKPIINLERLLEKVLKKGDYIAIKCYNTPGDNESGSYEINLPYYGGETPEERFVWKYKLLKALCPMLKIGWHKTWVKLTLT